MPAVGRVGDTSSHNGTITTGAAKMKVDGKAVARAGDSHVCPISGHGTTPLISNAKLLVEGKAVVRVGDTAACGAVIQQGSPTFTVA